MISIRSSGSQFVAANLKENDRWNNFLIVFREIFERFEAIKNYQILRG